MKKKDKHKKESMEKGDVIEYIASFINKELRTPLRKEYSKMGDDFFKKYKNVGNMLEKETDSLQDLTCRFLLNVNSKGKFEEEFENICDRIFNGCKESPTYSMDNEKKMKEKLAHYKQTIINFKEKYGLDTLMNLIVKSAREYIHKKLREPSEVA